MKVERDQAKELENELKAARDESVIYLSKMEKEVKEQGLKRGEVEMLKLENTK